MGISISVRIMSRSAKMYKTMVKDRQIQRLRHLRDIELYKREFPHEYAKHTKFVDMIWEVLVYPESLMPRKKSLELDNLYKWQRFVERKLFDGDENKIIWVWNSSRFAAGHTAFLYHLNAKHGAARFYFNDSPKAMKEICAGGTEQIVGIDMQGCHEARNLDIISALVMDVYEHGTSVVICASFPPSPKKWPINEMHMICVSEEDCTIV